MVVFHLKRVWETGTWHDLDFLYEAPAMTLQSSEICTSLTFLYGTFVAFGKFRALFDMSKLPPQAQEMITRILDAADKLFSPQQVSMNQCVTTEDAQTLLETLSNAARQVGISPDAISQAQTVPPCPEARIVWCKKFVDSARTVSELTNGNTKTVLNVFLTVDGSMPVFQ